MALFSSSRVSHRSAIPTISLAEDDLELDDDGSESSDPFGGIIVNSRPRYGKRSGHQLPDHFPRSSDHFLRNSDHFLRSSGHFPRSPGHFPQNSGHFLWSSDHFSDYKSGQSDGSHFSGHSIGGKIDQPSDPDLFQAVVEKSSLSMKPSSKSSGIGSSKSGHKVSRASSAQEDRKLQLCRSCLLMEGKGILTHEFWRPDAKKLHAK